MFFLSSLCCGIASSIWLFYLSGLPAEPPPPGLYPLYEVGRRVSQVFAHSSHHRVGPQDWTKFEPLQDHEAFWWSKPLNVQQVYAFESLQRYIDNNGVRGWKKWFFGRKITRSESDFLSLQWTGSIFELALLKKYLDPQTDTIRENKVHIQTGPVPLYHYRYLT